MDVHSAGGYTLLMDEKFDFDLSLSPKSEKEDDDEVFIGPVGHKEKCVAVSIEIQSHEAEEMPSKPNVQGVWSPLSGEKFVEIFKEAHLLALQLSSNRTNEQSKINKSDVQNSAVEEFVQESKAKLKIFQIGKEDADWSTPSKRETYCVPTPNKRETYCVADSPFSLLPPSFQQCLEIDVPHSTQSPAQVQRTPKNALPSVQKQKTSNSQTKNTSEKKGVGKLQHTKAMQGNGQQLAKLELNVQLKPPSANGPRKTTTSSSSSSSSSFSSINSSMNSSLSVSPLEGNAKSSSALNTSAVSRKLPSNTSRLGMVRHNVRSSSLQSDCANKSNQLVKPLKTSQLTSALKAIKPASISSLQTHTPVEKIHRQSSLPGLQRLSTHSKLESSGKENACLKGKASVVPTLKSQQKIPKRAPSPENAVPKIIQPDRNLSFSSRLSTPIKPPTHGELQTPGLSAKSILVSSSARRVSALPTPVSRRVSGIPTATPKSQPTAWTSPQLLLPNQASIMSTKKRGASSAQVQETRSQVVSNPALPSDGDASPPLLEPLLLDFSPEAKVTKSEIQGKAIASQPDSEVLIDFAAIEKPAQAMKTENKPLIDFTNTPEVHSDAPQKPSIGQLIDLSSPLIKLSPVLDKENLKLDSPLLKF